MRNTLPRINSSWDDGCASDLRVAELMSKYDIPTVFYWPVDWHSLAETHGYNPLEFPDAIDLSTDFEIGSHTITHRHLTSLLIPEAIYEVVQSKSMLEELFGRDVTKFCPPRGYTTAGLTQVALEIYDSQRLTKGPNLVHVHPDSGGNYNEPWRQRLEALLEIGEVEIWGHSWELDKYNLWSELEEALRDLCG